MTLSNDAFLLGGMHLRHTDTLLSFKCVSVLSFAKMLHKADLRKFEIKKMYV